MTKTRAEFDEYMGKMRAQKDESIARATAAFEMSAAVIVTEHGSAPELFILSGNMGKGKDSHRITFFMKDGPRGHHEGSIPDLMEYIASSLTTYKPVGDAEVIAWTSTDEFEVGSRRVAYVQALNELGYLAQTAATHDDKAVIREAMSRAQRMEDVEKATAFMQRVIHAHTPRKNPVEIRETDFDLIENPTPWVTNLLSTYYGQLEEKVPPAWLPKIAKAKAVGTTFTGELSEFGCGAFGCVLPTLDPHVVLKVTSDDTEAEFAAKLAETLPMPVCTAYFMVMDLVGKTRGPRSGVRSDGQGAKVYLLWREEAKEVGKIDKVVGQHAEAAIHRQHTAAMDAFIAIQNGKDARDLLERWTRACTAMGKVAELAFVSEGLLRAYSEAGVFISDTHGGNLGLCMRNGKQTWVVTDPGNVVVTKRASTSALPRSR